MSCGVCTCNDPPKAASMNRLLLVVFWSAMNFLTAAAQTIPIDTIVNPGFEIGTGGEAVTHGWTTTSSTGPMFVVDPGILPILESIDPNAAFDGSQFTPEFEGILNTKVVCTDDRGASAIGQINLFCINPGSWFNHPPVVSGGPTNPVVLKAGEELILHAPLFNIYDPDGDELYAVCNIGACGRDQDGAFIWTFQSNFPGYYDVEIFYYDIRGGYAVLWFPVEVKPWWSF